MNKILKISIIIPVHNQFNLLDQCLQSIIKNTHYDYEIILSDSNSHKLLQEFYNILDIYKHEIKVIYDNKNPGFSRAINNGMKAARGDSDYYVWLNSDTIVTQHWLRGTMYSDLCGPISNNATYQSMICIDQKDLSIIENFCQHSEIKDLKVDFLNGFCYIISKKVFQSVGFLDEVHFPHYGSEDDYSLRSKLKGFQAEILSNNFVFHFGNQSYNEKPKSEKRDCAKQFLSKHPKFWFDQLIMLHTVKTRNLRQQIVERFIKYVNSEI